MAPGIPSRAGGVEDSRFLDARTQARSVLPAREEYIHTRIFECTECGGQFCRQWELDRYTRIKHQMEKPWVCTVAGCFKGPNRTAFARPDKLTDHLRKVHSRLDMVHCPVNGCGKRLVLELIGAHIDCAHSLSYGSVKEQLRPLANASNANYRACPYWRCRKHVKLASFTEHIVSHSIDELNAMEEELRRENYFYVRSGCSHQAIVEGIHSCAVTALCIICPVCGEVTGSHAAFEQHAITRHLLKQDAAVWEHLFQWKHHLWANTVRSGPNVLIPWESWGRGEWKRRSIKECPFCREDFKDGRSQYDHSWHHLSLLRNTEEAVAELYPHRRAILRLYPDFKSHPVFADLK